MCDPTIGAITVHSLNTDAPPARATLLANGWSAEKAAAELGLNADYLRRVLRGSQAPSERVRQGLADLVGVAPDDLFQRRPGPVVFVARTADVFDDGNTGGDASPAPAAAPVMRPFSIRHGADVANEVIPERDEAAQDRAAPTRDHNAPAHTREDEEETNGA